MIDSQRALTLKVCMNNIRNDILKSLKEYETDPEELVMIAFASQSVFEGGPYDPRNIVNAIRREAALELLHQLYTGAAYEAALKEFE